MTRRHTVVTNGKNPPKICEIDNSCNSLTYFEHVVIAITGTRNSVYVSAEYCLNKNDVKSFHLDCEYLNILNMHFKTKKIGLPCEIANIWIN